MRVGSVIAVAVVIISLAGVLGYWLGEVSVPEANLPGNGAIATEEGPAEEDPDRPQVTIDPNAPPVFFHAHATANEWKVVAGEIAMAAEAGLHQYVVTVRAPYEPGADMPKVADQLQRVIDADPEAVFLVRVQLNPPGAWLKGNRNAAAHIDGQAMRYPTPASAAWEAQAKDALGVLAEQLARLERFDRRIMGYVLCALEDDAWSRPGYDTAADNRDGFRRWLARRYPDAETLQAAWGDDSVSADTAEIPAPLSNGDTASVFFSLPEEQNQVDFLRYTAESTADAIAALTTHLKKRLRPEQLVLASYGYTFEHFDAYTGHLGLGAIIDSDIDGFVAPVTYHDRALGGTGALMGPVHSVRLHGKQWFVVDDTRTGVGYERETGRLTRMEGLRGEDVFNVQRRNFATALVGGLGLVWADPEGEGWLHDPEQWRVFRGMLDIYRDYTGPGAGGTDAREAAAPAETPLDQQGRQLTVVIDERSRFYQQVGEPLSELLYNATRNAALRVGTPVTFVLLQDVLDEQCPPASAYLFLNAFRLDTHERARLHGLLERQKAAALWMYAPGYISEEGMAAGNVSETVRMKVAAFDGPGQSGSSYALAGRWVGENEAFGAAHAWAPLFYIDDDEVDVVANFSDSGRASIGVRFFESGWASVFVAEPLLPPMVMRELLHILEQPLYMRDPAKAHFDAVRIGQGMLAIHGRVGGERSIQFEDTCDVYDLFDPRIGWPRARDILLPLRRGETRLLRLAPTDTEVSGTAEDAPHPGESSVDPAINAEKTEQAPLTGTAQ
ncbi:MAG: beta-galactosidase [Candidatus Hydrogenedentota bacterium]